MSSLPDPSLGCGGVRLRQTPAPERDAFGLKRLPLGSPLRIRHGLRSTTGARCLLRMISVRKVCTLRDHAPASFAAAMESAIAVAFETLRLCIRPGSASRAMISQCSRVNRRMPLPSAPAINASGG